MRLDGFADLKKDIDGMVKDLKAEKAADVKQKDFCVEALHKNEVALEASADKEGAGESKIQNFSDRFYRTLYELLLKVHTNALRWTM